MDPARDTLLPFAMHIDEAALQRLSGAMPDQAAASAAALVALAWHLRQRDTARACQLASAAELRLRRERNNAHPILRGRIGLVRAEAAWLNAEVDLAERHLSGSKRCFRDMQDQVGQGDALLLESLIAFDSGRIKHRQDCLARALVCYRSAGDMARARLGDAWAVLGASYTGDGTLPDPAAERDAANGDPVAEGLFGFACSQLAFMAGDYPTAAIGFEAAAHALLDCGLVRPAVTATLNAACALGNLGDYEAQLSLVDRALGLARSRGWPLPLGACFYMLGDANHSLGRLEAAHAAFLDSRRLLAPLPNSRVYVVATTFLGETSLGLGRLDEARLQLEDAWAAARRGGHASLAPRAVAGLAACLSKLGLAEQARQLLQQALDDSEGRDLVSQRHALSGLAALHGAHDLPPPHGMTAPSAELHYIDRLWALQAKIPEWRPDEALLKETAAAWERAGDPARALDFERRRNEGLVSAGARRAAQQIAVTQARQEAEAARLEAERQRRQADEERGRLAVLEQLSQVGQEITATLDTADILRAVQKHIGTMLDVDALTLWRLDGEMLEPMLDDEAGAGVSAGRIALDDPRSDVARVARERREILVEDEDAVRWSTSLLAPLLVGQSLFGVMAIRSRTPNAYGERERLVFRNISIYSAIALGNAAHYRLLTESHERLIQAQDELERLANHDALTGLYNRRFLMQAAALETARAERHGGAPAVLLLDLDHFKAVNDTYGHAAGDVALKAVAEAIIQILRPSDIAARYGGEEFVVLLPDSDHDSAVRVAERLRRAIEASAFDAGGMRFGLTASIGGTIWARGEVGIEAALRRADACLYQVKAEGRNRVVLDPRGQGGAP
jgi:diguanylate cyclase (GGDEF)-like protein